MILVVAMLSVLFVVGVTFLTTVTFESRSIAGAKLQQQKATVVESLSREIRRALIRSFLGDDGKPWNRDSEATGLLSPIGNDISGEIPGVHPLLASVEPYDTGAGWFFFDTSDLESMLADRALTSPLLVDVGLGTSSPDERIEGNSVPGGDTYRRDADGDGVWDSYEYLLPQDRFPDSVRGGLGDELKTEAADENEIYYAVRVIPHGAMVHVAHAHKTLLDELLGSEAVNIAGPYVEEGEEIHLRRRGLIPPRALALSQLQNPLIDVGQIPTALYGAFGLSQDPLGYRWWPIRTGTDGQDITEITGVDPDPGWIDWVDPDPANPAYNYDVRHLLTTVSHDDQLMRIGRSTNDVSLDWIEEIGANSGNFAIDDWPDAVDPTNKLNGRLKVSLPGLVTRILIPEGLPLFGPGGTYEGREIDALSDPALNSAVRDRFIWTIQDAFLLMLRNVDDAQWPLPPAPTKSQAAAALTANLIDFADFDGDTDGNGVRDPGEGDDKPTKVDIRDIATGLPTGNAVYGLERQPYITELFHLDNTNETAAAIELFNPYEGQIDLSNYTLKAQYDDELGIHILVDEQLSGNLPGRETLNPYKVFVSQGTGGPSGDQLGDDPWGFTPNVIVELFYTGGADRVLVDRFEAPNTGLFGKSIPRSLGYSLQRFTGDTSVTGGWTALVPKFGPELSGHTMDGINNDNVWIDTTIRPVQIDFADTGDMASAFPTTGTLLLLCRYANTANDPFTGKLSTDRLQIDNGRMPVFEQTMKAQPDPDLSTNGTPFDLNIAWGQLVFDYFTALPLSNQYAYDPVDPQTWDDITPTIDEGGLRVHGRIDINSAPWTVLAGLPLVASNDLPEAFRSKIIATIPTLLPTAATPIGLIGNPSGFELAQSIVAYREARQISDGIGSTHNFGGTRLRGDINGSPLSGFLTVGELANVRRPGGGGGAYDIDSGVIDGTPNEDYVKAVAVLVALGDWVTTRSHVFTVYATLRGSGTKSAVDEKAIRFQETVDRLPSFFNNRMPRRVGPRVVGSYAQASQD